MTIVINPDIVAVRDRIADAIGFPERDEPAFSAQMTGITAAVGAHIARIAVILGATDPEAAAEWAVDIFARQVRESALLALRGGSPEVRQ